MPEDLGSKHKSPASSLQWEHLLVRKVNKFEQADQYFWVISKKRQGGVTWNPPPRSE